MPTGRGWLVAAAGVALWAVSGVLGVGALSQLGFGLVVLVVVAVVVVRIGKHDVRVERTLTPERVQAGREVTVTLDLANKGRGSAPLLLLEDHVPPELAGRARFAIRGIEARGSRHTRFTVRPLRRGRYSVGPLEVTVMDPFGVARLRSQAAGRTSFLVYPRTEPLALPKDSGNRRTMTVSARRQPTGNVGEDFYTLREYVEGDDLRRIHWPATAKRNRYMIRQEETPWHARATILLDDRAAAHQPAGWERSVEVAASMVDLYHRSGYAFRLVRPLGPGVASSRGSDHYHRCLDLLAVAETGSSRNGDEVDPLLMKLSELESQTMVEGILICVMGTPSVEVAHALTRTSRRFKLVVAVMLPTDGYRLGHGSQSGGGAATGATHLLARAGLKSLVIEPGDVLAQRWSAMWKVWGPAPAALEEVGGGI